MLSCFLCQKGYPSSRQLISHIRVEHSYYPGPKFKLLCFQPGCRRHFLTYNGFRKHLNSVHSVEQISQTSNVEGSSELVASSSEPVASSSSPSQSVASSSLAFTLGVEFNSPHQHSSSGVFLIFVISLEFIPCFRCKPPPQS